MHICICRLLLCIIITGLVGLQDGLLEAELKWMRASFISPLPLCSQSTPKCHRVREGRQQLGQIQGVAHVCTPEHGPAAGCYQAAPAGDLAAQPERSLSVGV